MLPIAPVSPTKALKMKPTATAKVLVLIRSSKELVKTIIPEGVQKILHRPAAQKKTVELRTELEAAAEGEQKRARS